MSDKIYLTGLFKGKDGSPVLWSGKTNQNYTIPSGTRLCIFENNRKKSDNSPPWNLVAYLPDGNDDGGFGGGGNNQPQPPKDDDVGGLCPF